MGDFNAKIGRDWRTWREVIGKHGYGEKMSEAKGCYIFALIMVSNS